MDANLIQQIYPLIANAERTLSGLTYLEKESLTADLYLAMVGYSNKEIPKYMNRMQKLENLKFKDGKAKDAEFLANLQKSQDSVVEESKIKQSDLLTEIYNNWLDNLERD